MSEDGPVGFREWRLRCWRDEETGEDRLEVRMGECARVDMEVFPAIEQAVIALTVSGESTESWGRRPAHAEDE